jgi:hypothetical protein
MANQNPNSTRASEALTAAAFGAVAIAGWMAFASVLRFGGPALALPPVVFFAGGLAAASVLRIGWLRRVPFAATIALGGLGSVVGLLGSQGMNDGSGALRLMGFFAMYFAVAYAIAGVALFAAFGGRWRDAIAVIGGFCVGGMISGAIAGVVASREMTLVTPLFFIWIPGAVGGAAAADRINRASTRPAPEKTIN